VSSLVLLSKWSRNPTPFHDVSDFSNDRASIPEDLNHQDGTRVHRHPSVLLALLSPSPARTPLFDSICSVAVLTIVVLVMLDTFVIVTMEIRFHSLVVQETIVFSNRAASLISDPEEQWTCPAGHFCLEGAIEPLPRPSAHVPLGMLLVGREDECHQWFGETTATNGGLPSRLCEHCVSR
jgi:hypothetical protein